MYKLTFAAIRSAEVLFVLRDNIITLTFPNDLCYNIPSIYPPLMQHLKSLSYSMQLSRSYSLIQ